MKKFLIFTLAALAVLVSCQKENLQNSESLILDKITITDGSSHVAVYKVSSGAIFYMNLPAGTYTRMAVYDGNFKVAERIGLSIVIKENTLLPASTSDLTFNSISDALPGTFTIDKNGNWIHFSKGNLQATYTGSSYSWGFAANQYDIVGGTDNPSLYPAAVTGNNTIDSQTNAAGAVFLPLHRAIRSASLLMVGLFPSPNLKFNCTLKN